MSTREDDKGNFHSDKSVSAVILRNMKFCMLFNVVEERFTLKVW
jgi:hypothetical protein